MPTYTLLQMTQEILSKLDSDQVNSINDTEEATQVARIVRQSYYDMIDDLNLPEHHSMFELTASGDNTKPTMMTIPSDINRVLWVKYNKIMDGDTNPVYEEVCFKPMKEFLTMMYQLNEDETNIGTFDISTDTDTIAVKYRDDVSPRYYTVFGDDYTILFDSYDSAVDTTLQKSKTICYGKKDISMGLLDATVPDMDANLFPRLMNEATALAFAELKQMAHPIAERNARRSRNKSGIYKFRVKPESDWDQLPNFGRK